MDKIDIALMEHNEFARKAAPLRERIAELESALSDVRTAIIDQADDTVWVSWIETAVDRIDGVLYPNPYVVAVAAAPMVCPSCDEEIEIGDDIVETKGETVCSMCFHIEGDK